MDDKTFVCSRCGAPLRYDAATGLLWCPEADCGFVVPRHVHAGSAGEDTDGGQGQVVSFVPSRALENDAEWKPEPWSRRRRILTAVVVFATAAAVLALALSPLLRPQRPSLQVSPAELSFVDLTGRGVMPQALAVQNKGGGRLDWVATVDVPWLELEPASGSIETELQILTVRVDVIGLPEGTHFATLSITGVNALNSPQQIPVHIQLVTLPEATFIKELLGESVAVHYDVDPPYVSGPMGVSIHLVQNDMAVDVTWQELFGFLALDKTDEDLYIQDLYMCGGFSEALHNNAEAAGIRTAWVCLDMHGREIGHALNAFLTTDRGLVFVDCTGGDAAVAPVAEGSGRCNHDKVAYVRPGLECGLISIDQAESTSYEFYIAYSDAWNSYVTDMEEYNRLEAEWSDFVDGRLIVPGSSDAREERRLRSDLQARRISLEIQKGILGECRWKDLGVVEMVRIYW
jgi:hypothetical protein